MKILIRIGIALVVLLALGVAAVALLVPPLLKSDALRARIESAAESALGLEVRYADLDVGLFPPSLLVGAPSVAERGAKKPLVEAQEVALRVALAPLLTRTVVLDSLVIEGATVRVERTKDGFVLPLPPPGEVEIEPAPDAGGPPLKLALRSVELRSSTLVVADRSVSPPVTWELRDVDVRLRGSSPDEPFDVKASLALASGGSLEVRGSAALSGELDLALDLSKVALAHAKPYLAGAGELAGELSGKVAIRGAAASPEALDLDLRLANGALALDEISLRGPVAVKAKLAGPLATPRGRFELDATGAALQYGDVFSKPAGTAATVSGQVAPGDGGTLQIDDVKLKIRDLDARAAVQTGKRLRVSLRPQPLDLKGWEELVPALAGYELRGPVKSEELVLRTEPLELRGAIQLDGVQARLSDGRDVRVRGGVLAEGQRIRTRDLELVAADQVIAVEAEVDDLGGALPFRVRARAREADANRLVSTFAGRRDFLFGLLGLELDLAGSAAGDGSLLQGLRGEGRFDLREGKLVGVSLLRSAFDGLGAAANLAALPVALLKGGKLQRFYGENFDNVSGSFQLAGGTLHTQDLRAVYRNYTVEVKGNVGLESYACDLRGSLVLGAEVQQELAATAPGSAPPVSQAVRSIPFALRGSPCDLSTATVTQSAATAFLTGYLPSLVPPELAAPVGEILRQLPTAGGLGDLIGLPRRPPAPQPPADRKPSTEPQGPAR